MKDATIGGSLVSPSEGGVTNWEPPAFNPDTGLFYVAEDNSYSIFYLLDPDPRGSMGLGGKLEAHVGSAGSYLTAIDYKTGKAVWREEYPGVFGGGGGGGGLLTTAGGLVFAGDAGGNIVAHDAKTGKPLWHSTNRRRVERADYLHARRPPVPARGIRRHALRVRALPVRLTSDDMPTTVVSRILSDRRRIRMHPRRAIGPAEQRVRLVVADDLLPSA